MSKRYHRLLKNQAQVKVAAYVDNNPTNKARFVAFAVAFMGFFFFFSGMWRALTGG